MSVNVRVRLNSVSEIIRRHGLHRDGRVTEFLRDTIYRLYQPYVPRDDGNLYRQVQFPNKNSIKHTVPYAHYMYHGKLWLAQNGSSWARFGERKVETGTSLKYHIARTGAKWDKLMLQRRKNDLIRDVENYIKGG